MEEDIDGIPIQLISASRNQRLGSSFFWAKISPTVDPFGLALISTLVKPIGNVFFFAFEDIFGLTFLRGVFLASSRSVTVIFAPLREALSLSSLRSFSLPSLSQQCVEEASFLHGVCSRN